MEAALLTDIIARGLNVVQGEEDAAAAINRALGAARRHLNVEVAYVSEILGNTSHFRHVDAPGLEALIKPGDQRSMDDVYCGHILAGRLPELITDTANFPLAVSMPNTTAVPIGAHVSVPLRLADGSVYGMFCCLSPTPNASLNQRDLDLVRVLADVTAQQINHDLEKRRDRARNLAEIDQVIADGSITFVYQPIFSFSPYALVGFEALCRFSAPPPRTPDIWFRQAAALGRGVQLEIAALRVALEALTVLPRDIFVSINTSPDTILSGALHQLLADAPMNRLVLEVTEHAPVRNYAALATALAPMRAAGARLAIDDAGAGYSSLQHILQLKQDIIKLDIELTRAVDTDQARRALAGALTRFAVETNASLVAEGIETESELRSLQALGVSKGQGYFLGRPMPLPKAIALASAPSRDPAVVQSVYPA